MSQDTLRQGEPNNTWRNLVSLHRTRASFEDRRLEHGCSPRSSRSHHHFVRRNRGLRCSRRACTAQTDQAHRHRGGEVGVRGVEPRVPSHVHQSHAIRLRARKSGTGHAMSAACALLRGDHAAALQVPLNLLWLPVGTGGTCDAGDDRLVVLANIGRNGAALGECHHGKDTSRGRSGAPRARRESSSEYWSSTS